MHRRVAFSKLKIVGANLEIVFPEGVSRIRESTVPSLNCDKIVIGPNRDFEACGLNRKHWSGAGPIRKVFKDAFKGAGLPYFIPHSFRKTLVQLGEKLCRTPEQFKA